jgi:hypothetical protein
MLNISSVQKFVQSWTGDSVRNLQAILLLIESRRYKEDESTLAGEAI